MNTDIVMAPFHPVYIPDNWHILLGIIETEIFKVTTLSLIVDDSSDIRTLRELEDRIYMHLCGLPNFNHNRMFVISTPIDSTVVEVHNISKSIHQGLLIIDNATFNAIIQSDTGVGQCLIGNRIILHKNGLCTYYKTAT